MDRGWSHPPARKDSWRHPKSPAWASPLATPGLIRREAYIGVQRDNPSGKGIGGCAPSSTTHVGGWAGTTPVPLWDVVQIGNVQKVHKLSGGKDPAKRDTWPPAGPQMLRLRSQHDRLLGDRCCHMRCPPRGHNVAQGRTEMLNASIGRLRPRDPADRRPTGRQRRWRSPV